MSIDNAQMLPQSLPEMVESFFKRREPAHIKSTFEKYSKQESDCRKMNFQGFEQALDSLKIVLTHEELEDLFKSMDLDDNGVLCEHEFVNATLRATKLEQWTATLPLPQLLASSLPLKVHRGDPLRGVANLSPTEVKMTTEVFSLGIQKLLIESLKTLKDSLAVLDKVEQENKVGSKFRVDIRELCGGTMEDFDRGLIGRIGAPHPNLQKAIKDEHCHKAGCNEEFTTSNYNVTTTPRKEYLISTGRMPCPHEDMLGANRTVVRKIIGIDVLEQLPFVKMAQLIREEVLQIVLYTGPMFQVYNLVLRQFPPEKFNYYKDHGNLFATSIHVVVSGVIKIARTMKLQPGLRLYRGLGGTLRLPDRFWKVDQRGRRGYMEWGLLSTTTDKSIAMTYSGATEGKPLPIVLCLSVGSVDRGARIAELSQYPKEVEYLWVPCSYLEPQGSPSLEIVKDSRGDISGVVQVIEIRASANLRALTVEDLRSQQKTIHITAFSYMVQELVRDLKLGASAPEANTTFLPGEAKNLKEMFEETIKKSEETFERHKQTPAEDYTDDGKYRNLVTEMLEIKETFQVRMKRLFLSALKDSSLDILRVLLEARVNVKLTNQDGTQAVILAAKESQWKVVQLLAEKGADVKLQDEEGRSLVLLSAGAGNTECLEALIAKKADINTASKYGVSPVLIAAKNQHWEAMKLLILHQADVNVKDDKTGQTLVYMAADDDAAECLQLLIDKKANLRESAKNGASPLKICKQKGHSKCLQLLTSELTECSRGTKVSLPLVSPAVERVFGADVLKEPYCVAIDRQGRFWVSDAKLHNIVRFECDGKSPKHFGSKGKGAEQFYVPWGVAIDSAGNVIIADCGNHRIQMLNADGDFIFHFGARGKELGELMFPHGVAIDRQERIVVADSGNNRIQIFNADGTCAHAFDSKTDPTNQLQCPMGVGVDQAGRIMVADADNHRIQILNSDGTVALSVGSYGDKKGQLNYPYGVAVDPKGRLVVCEQNNDRLQVFNPDGSPNRIIGSSGADICRLKSPFSVVVSQAGQIVVVEGGDNHRLQVLDKMLEGA